MKKKILYCVGALVVLLLLTNPGERAVSDFIGESEFKSIHSNNFGVFSIYNIDFVTADDSFDQHKYFAILGGFYEIKN